MAKRASQSKLLRIDGILARALKKRHVPFRSEDRRLIEVWERAVGSQIAVQSRANYINRGILFVKVSTSVWMHQLHFLKEEIICQVNSFMKENPVKDIRFTLGWTPPPTLETPDPLPFPDNFLNERDKKMIEACLASLKDEELQSIIKRVMTKEIAHRRRLERQARRK